MDDHLATIWESIADRLAGEIALAHGNRRVSWRDFERRAARFAAALASAGVGPGQTVAIDMYNGPEYLEVFFAALKIRAVPANVNYRYLDEELTVLLRQSEAVVLVYHADLRERVSHAAAAVPGLRLLAEAGSAGLGSTLPGARSYEALIGSHQPAPRIFRPGTDTFLSYTGGTTGLPKGVEYVIGNSVRNTRMLGRQMLGLEDIDWEGPALDRALLLHRQGRRPVALPASPLMHSTGLIMASLPVLTAGGTVVTLTARSFDPDELFTAVAATRPRTVSIAGDAFARPMVRALDRRASAGDRYDTTSLVTITSAGVAWSAEVKRALLEHIPQVVLVDACGSSEGATIGSMIYRRGGPLATDRFQPASGLRILRAGEDGEGLEPAAVSAAVRARLAGYKVPRTVLIAPVPRAPNGKVLVEAARRLFSADGPRTGAPLCDR